MRVTFGDRRKKRKGEKKRKRVKRIFVLRIGASSASSKLDRQLVSSPNPRPRPTIR